MTLLKTNDGQGPTVSHYVVAYALSPSDLVVSRPD